MGLSVCIYEHYQNNDNTLLLKQTILNKSCCKRVNFILRVKMTYTNRFRQGRLFVFFEPNQQILVLYAQKETRKDRNPIKKL